MDSATFDWERLLAAKWKPKTRRDRKREEQLRRTLIPKPLPGEPYVGPIPLWWWELAHEVRASDLVVPLWFKAVVKKSGTFRFNASSDAEGEFGVPHSSAAKQLLALEEAKLIKLDNLNGRPAWVTLLPTPKEK